MVRLEELDRPHPVMCLLKSSLWLKVRAWIGGQCPLPPPPAPRAVAKGMVRKGL